MHFHAWTVFPLSLSGIWRLKCFIPYRTEKMDPRESHGESRRQLSCQTCVTPSQSSTPTSFQQTFIKFHQLQSILVPMVCCIVFEDNEAVFEIIIKDRSPTMRHVSRTDRVALDWLFDRINLDPKIQIKYVDTKNQLDDILTEIQHVMNGIIFCVCLIS